jgi:hypothetical protein
MRVATFAAGFMLVTAAVAAPTPIVVDALTTPPLLALGPDQASATPPAFTAGNTSGGSVQLTNSDVRGSSTAIRYFNLDGGIGNANSDGSNHSYRDATHGQSHEHHYEKEGGTSVSSVPLPVGFWLFGSGLIALFAAARQGKAQS